MGHVSKIIPAALLLAVTALAGCGDKQPPLQAPADAPAAPAAAAPVQNADNAATPLAGGLQASDRSTIQCSVDLASGAPISGPVTLSRANAAVFEGWAFAAGQPSLVAPVLIFSGKEGTFQAKVNAGNARPDVASSFGLPEAENAGFTSMVNVTSLPTGDYQLWLATGPDASDKACDLKVNVVIND